MRPVGICSTIFSTAALISRIAGLRLTAPPSQGVFKLPEKITKEKFWKRFYVNSRQHLLIICHPNSRRCTGQLRSRVYILGRIGKLCAGISSQIATGQLSKVSCPWCTKRLGDLAVSVGRLTGRADRSALITAHQEPIPITYVPRGHSRPAWAPG